MKFLFTVLLAAVFFVGCERIEGQLNVTKDLKLVNSNGDTHLLRVGTYSADLRESTFGKKIVLRLNNDANEKFHFLIPGNTSIPDNGTFKLSSSQIGQNVDLAGEVRTSSVDSNPQQMYQACTYNEPYTVCQPAGPNGQEICQTYYRTVYGSQWIQFIDRTTHQDVRLSIAAKGDTSESAQFSGNASWIQRIILNQSFCR